MFPKLALCYVLECIAENVGWGEGEGEREKKPANTRSQSNFTKSTLPRKSPGNLYISKPVCNFIIREVCETPHWWSLSCHPRTDSFRLIMCYTYPFARWWNWVPEIHLRLCNWEVTEFKWFNRPLYSMAETVLCFAKPMWYPWSRNGLVRALW